MGITSMVDRATAQVEIVTTFDRTDVQRDQKPYRTIALATFYWEAEEDWTEFARRVASVGDRMFMEFDDEKNVTQYIQFKTGGEL
jgi:hypothetical protein